MKLLLEIMLSINQVIAIGTVIAAIIIFFVREQNKLREKQHELELKMKDLEKKDGEQQQVIDSLKIVFDILHEKKQSKKAVKEKSNGESN